MNSFMKEKKGAISIVMVVCMLIGALIISGFVDLLKRSYTMNEIGAIMDVASVTALRAGVDDEMLRVEDFKVDRSIVLRNYKNLVQEASRDYGHLTNLQFVKTNIEEFNENWGLGLTGKSRPQVLIDSTIIIEVDSNALFNTAPIVAKKFYDARSNGDFTVSYNRATDDGKIELSLRSVSRVVYR